ncbi:glycosyltransferase family 4 protein [Acetobacter sacchari]|uniref:Glycosyltransferase family 4 protein n=1 Tax=Acetobacter sacchari TaxID=2661687 RepID=A0ABS3LY78_9PROT|nr:glycosyltransferase family 1 protein [Acetobacter sacchari]MBO1360866.1 glycosyltransferase family 4 protein [Acetobacter sacchari]
MTVQGQPQGDPTSAAISSVASRPTFWIDVEDFFEYARANGRPSGIQRVAFEICLALQSDPALAGRVRFVRHTVSGGDLIPVQWEEIYTLYRRMTAETGPAGVLERGGAGEAAPSRLRRLALKLPTQLRVPLGQTISHSVAAAKSGGALLRAAKGAAVRALDERRGVKGDSDASPAVFSPAQGDVLLVLGAAWSHADYASLLRRCRDQHGMRIGLLIYDLIPLLWPEWCRPGLSRVFRRWHDAVLPECDAVFAISNATHDDIISYAASASLNLRAPVTVIPMGSGFTGASAEDHEAAAMAEGLGRYVLCVGTIEARKNHALLFRVWRKLLKSHAPETLPKLVFAGSPGWLVDDLMQQIRNSDYLNGHLVIVRGPSDSQIDALYKRSLFTVFPSFYEGWGLPVTESLAHGRPCLISNRASLPEAGGGLVDSFDPDNVSEAFQVIERMIFEPPTLAQAEAVVTGFKPVLWNDAAQRIVTTFA